MSNGIVNMNVKLLSITPDAERLIERAGRTAYQSFRHQKDGSEKTFIRKITKKGHGSVLEHAYATFEISGVSRVFTHQLIRHRLCSFTQRSQRYVDERDMNYIEPDSVSNKEEAHSVFIEFMESARKSYGRLKELGIRNEDARFVLPNAVETQIVVTANLREWRHIVKLRCTPAAQWEIRRVTMEILRKLKEVAPTAFEDFEIDEGKDRIRMIAL
ncbi:MAG: FAD-dependent thymidylate synthase [Candidatus Thermoplasmatota archaeon]|jgi:thymidylate synthase (FAD)|nr:FAD-dependent thymidylate synthase [Candidatus Thermoplasmatota archaeon]